MVDARNVDRMEPPVISRRAPGATEPRPTLESISSQFPSTPLRTGAARVPGAERTDYATVLQPRLDAARAALAQTPPDVATAARQMTGLPQPYNDESNLSMGTSLNRAMSRMGLSTEQCRAVEQLRVIGTMSAATNRAVGCPPSADDLRAYGASLREQPLSVATAAFAEYSNAFNVHIATLPQYQGTNGDGTLRSAPDLAYPERASPAAAFPGGDGAPAGIAPDSSSGGRTIQDCDGYALQGQAFFQGAVGSNGRVQFAAAVESGVPLDQALAHRMLLVTRGDEHAMVSSQRAVVTSGVRLTDVRAELGHVTSMNGVTADVYVSDTFSNSPSRRDLLR